MINLVEKPKKRSETPKFSAAQYQSSLPYIESNSGASIDSQEIKSTQVWLLNKIGSRVAAKLKSFEPSEALNAYSSIKLNNTVETETLASDREGQDLPSAVSRPTFAPIVRL